MAITSRQEWDGVLDFWFPEGRSLTVEAPAHHAHWRWRMQGGADDEIMPRFSDLTAKTRVASFYQVNPDQSCS
ncbi:hypothetical protein LZG00_13535 [Rhodobacteraceae bacterium LMO-12]|nr:hypothetical protein [Rhodobacteraceae bacterium LMO-JJ12]